MVARAPSVRCIVSVDPMTRMVRPSSAGQRTTQSSRPLRDKAGYAAAMAHVLAQASGLTPRNADCEHGPVGAIRLVSAVAVPQLHPERAIAEPSVVGENGCEEARV